MGFISNLFKSAAVQEQPQVAASPTPFLTNLLSGTAAAMPQDYVTATAQERKPTISSSRTSVTKKKKTPLSNKTEMDKEAKALKEKALTSVKDVMGLGQDAQSVGEQVSQEIAPSDIDRAQRTVDVFEKLKSFRNTAKPGDRLDTKMFESIVPKDEDFLTALNQGLDLQAATNPEDLKNVSENKYLQGIGKKLLEEKLSDPYRNVNYEFADRAISSLGGVKPIGLKNSPGAEDNVQLLAQLNKLKQGYDQFRAKEVGDYASSVLKPVITGGVTSQVLPPPQPRQGRAGPQPKEIRATEIKKYMEPVKQAQSLSQKTGELLDLVNKIKAHGLAKTTSKEISQYNTLVSEVINVTKTLNNYGANFSGVEQRLSKANIPGSFAEFAAKQAVGLFTGEDTLKSYQDYVNKLAENEYQTAKQGFLREGEPGFIDSMYGGRQEALKASELNKPQAAPKAIQDILNKYKKAK